MKHLLKKAFLLLALVGGASNAWADSQTIKAGTVSSGAFTYSSLMEYTYSSGYWASGNNDVISIEKGSFTLVNAQGVTITDITVNGVNEANGDSKTATITISDGVNTATTGSVSWVGRKSSTPSSHAMTGVSGLTMEANTTYTVNVSAAEKNMYITLEITYTTASTTAAAKWDWQNNDLSEYNVEGVNATGNITVSGLTLHACAAVEGTNIKLTDSGDYAQMNKNTEIQVPVQSVTDVVTIVSYDGQYNYSVGGVSATANTTNHTATMREVAQGYVSIVATSTAYIYSVEVKQYAKDTAPALQSFTAGGTTYYADELEWTESPTNTFNTQINVASLPISVSAQQAYVGTATLSSYTEGVATIVVTKDETTKNYVVTFAVSRTLIYDANGGAGEMDNTIGSGNITLTPNAYTKTGYTFMGWATSQANADAGTVAYADGAAYTLSDDATLFAVWATSDYSFAPTSSSGDISSGTTVATSTGGKMVFTPIDDDNSATLKYSTTSGKNCIEFGKNGKCAVTITLDKVMKVGTVITLNYYVHDASARGFYLANSEGTNKATFSQNVIGTYTGTYTVVADDGLAGNNKFIIKRNNTAYLNSLTVVNCDQAVPVTVTSAGWATLYSPYALDFSETDLTAYTATCSANTVALTPVTNVPANTGVVLKGDEGNYNIPVIASSSTDKGNLRGSATEPTAYNAFDGFTLYVLTSVNEGANVQFNPVTSGSIAAGKAYLKIAGGASSARSMEVVFADDILTGISEAEAATEAIVKEGKFFENGKLVIFKKGMKFNANGQVIK